MRFILFEQQHITGPQTHFFHIFPQYPDSVPHGKRGMTGA
jgi:hypothetical protein